MRVRPGARPRQRRPKRNPLWSVVASATRPCSSRMQAPSTSEPSARRVRPFGGESSSVSARRLNGRASECSRLAQPPRSGAPSLVLRTHGGAGGARAAAAATTYQAEQYPDAVQAFDEATTFFRQAEAAVRDVAHPGGASSRPGGGWPLPRPYEFGAGGGGPEPIRAQASSRSVERGRGTVHGRQRGIRA